MIEDKNLESYPFEDKYLIGAAICASIWVIYKFGYEMGNVSYKLYADLSPLF